MAQRIKTNMQKVIVGNDEVIDLMLVALIASGHILLEDVPGTGKTLIAKTLAKSIDCEFHRIQFTPDLLPSDLSGIHYFNQKLSDFQFRPGPLFTNILLADEINRTTPRTQSSLLECMEERQITIDGETHVLEPPFMVIATQNPIENQGTYPLPEAQLDRFLLKVSMGYPTHESGFEILRRFQREDPLANVQPVVRASDIVAAGQSYTDVRIDDDVVHYLLNIVERTRQHKDVLLGVSPRGSQALLKAARVYAILQGRSYVIPDDVKKMVPVTLAHRIVPRQMMLGHKQTANDVLQQILGEVRVPTEETLVRG